SVTRWMEGAEPALPRSGATSAPTRWAQAANNVLPKGGWTSSPLSPNFYVGRNMNATRPGMDDVGRPDSHVEAPGPKTKKAKHIQFTFGSSEVTAPYAPSPEVAAKADEQWKK